MDTGTQQNSTYPEDYPSRVSSNSWSPATRPLFMLLGAYFVVQFGLRLLISPSLELDEAEQLVLGQQFSLGYGSSPPLYTWIQMVFFGAMGEGLPALSLFKNLLLFGIYFLTYIAGKQITRSQTGGMAAALTMLFIPQFVWESQRDLTHSVLAALLSLATLIALINLLDRRRLLDYVAFGLCGGLGILSKYNYLFWWCGLVVAALSLKEYRGAILNWRIAIALIVTAGVFLPHGLWLLDHKTLAMTDASKFNIGQSTPLLVALGTAGKNIIEAVAAYTLPLAAVYCLVFYGSKPSGDSTTRNDVLRLMIRALIVIGVLLLILIGVTRATGLRGRWFQPMLVCLPLLLSALFCCRLDKKTLRRMTSVACIVMLAIPVALLARYIVASKKGREIALTKPYLQVALAMRNTLPAGAVVVAETRLLAGNLRLGLPDTRVLTPELVPFLERPMEHCTIVWEARNDQPPEPLLTWARQNSSAQLKIRDKRLFEAPFKMNTDRKFRVGTLSLF